MYDNVISLGKYKLISLNGIAFFFEFSTDPTVYYGEDTYALATYTERRPVKYAIDLCSGSGIQAMLASFWAKKVIGVEKNLKAAKIAQLNIALNQLSKKIEIVQGDAIDFLISQREASIDLLTCNPPLIPVPTQFKLQFVADGGYDGLFLTKNIVRKGFSKLSKNASMHIIGAGYSRHGKYDVYEKCCKYISKHGGRSTLAILSKSLVAPGNLLFDSFCYALSQYNKCSINKARDAY